MACSVATGILETVSTRNNIFTFIVSAYKGGKICNQCKRSIILNIWEFQCMQQGAQSLSTEPESHESLPNSNNQDSENLK